DHHGGAFCRQLCGDALADPLTCSGHDGDLVVQLAHGVASRVCGVVVRCVLAPPSGGHGALSRPSRCREITSLLTCSVPSPISSPMTSRNRWPIGLSVE